MAPTWSWPAGWPCGAGCSSTTTLRRVDRLLRGVRDQLTMLRAAQALEPAASRTDELRFGGVKYYLAAALEGCIDAAQHQCGAEGWGVPKSNADVMLVLARHNVLGPDLAARMGLAVGFRNILVHRYLDEDDDIVMAHLEELDDVEALCPPRRLDGGPASRRGVRPALTPAWAWAGAGGPARAGRRQASACGS